MINDSEINDRDPLHVLHGDDLPVQPDPQFAARLRRRLETARTLPEGVIMSGTDTAIKNLSTAGALHPYLTVADARAAISWYLDIFGATVLGDPIVMDDNRIGHAELRVGTGVLYLADAYPELGLTAPAPGATSVSLMLPVADTDTVLERARSGGARVQREPYEDHGARNASIIDPFGHRWMLTGPTTEAAATIAHGDVGYVSVWAPDAARAAAFYGHVLGWVFDPDTGQVTNTTQPIGIHDAGSSTLFCCYAVTDLEGARRSIVRGGGQPGAITEFDFGTVLDATDSQGMAFAVFTPKPGTPRPALNGTGPGELSYITYQVPDAAEFRSFYSGLLFWTFAPGRVDDGWEISGTHPMAGAAGGSTTAVTMPMWTVADIGSAVGRVREAGGTVQQEPNRQSYGLMAECTDDQGGRFYLGEF
ncbi:MAG: VOC family protein [Mycobacterium sp.]